MTQHFPNLLNHPPGKPRSSQLLPETNTRRPPSRKTNNSRTAPNQNSKCQQAQRTKRRSYQNSGTTNSQLTKPKPCHALYVCVVYVSFYNNEGNTRAARPIRSIASGAPVHLNQIQPWHHLYTAGLYADGSSGHALACGRTKSTTNNCRSHLLA